MVTPGSRLGTKSSNLWEPAVPCNGNLWFPRWQQRVPTFGNRQFLAMNQTQTFRYRSIKQNQAFCTGPLSKKNHKVVTKMFSDQFKVACNGNPWFPGWEPRVPTSGNRQFLAMVTCGSQVGKREFQPLGTGSCLQW